MEASSFLEGCNLLAYSVPSNELRLFVNTSRHLKVDNGIMFPPV